MLIGTLRVGLVKFWPNVGAAFGVDNRASV